MAKPISRMLVLTAVIASLGTPAASQTAGPGQTCKKKLSRMGIPHRIKTIAQINAIRAWSEGSVKHGRDYAIWHYAGGDSVKCKKLPGSEYYRCTAAGRPCLPPGKTAANTAN